MERLSPDDLRILRLESEAIAGHTLKVAIVDPDPGGRPLTVEAVRRRVTSRLAHVPRGRQRLAPTPLRLAAPVWVDDADFDIRNHIRAAAEPVGDRIELARFAARAMAERLDHARPLWCIDVAPLEDGRTALLVRLHHCLADGVSCLRIVSRLLWDSGADGPAMPGSWQPRSAPGKMRLLAAGAVSRLRGTGGALAGAGRGAASARRWREAGRELIALPGVLRRELWPLGARTPFDRRIGGDREVAFTGCELEDLKRIERAAGAEVTVNDVVLAVVAGAIRRWLAERHEPAHAMRVQIPASMHHRNEDPGELGNRDSFLFCDLPVSEPDPRRRLAAINAETRSRKQHHDPDELYSFFHSLSHVRPLYRVASGLASGPRAFSLAISNVPGPAEPVHVLGGRVAALYSAAEPAQRHALRVSAISLAGRLGFGFCTDPGAVSGVAELAEGFDAALDELRGELISPPRP
jgi:diacylglycerol O-acyltransferase / wax synthase